MFETILKVNPAWQYVGHQVRARKAIQDSPLAKKDGSCKARQLGFCHDFAEADNLLYVDFGGGAIAVYPKEITWP